MALIKEYETKWFHLAIVAPENHVAVPDLVTDAMLGENNEINNLSETSAYILFELLAVEQGKSEINDLEDLRRRIQVDYSKPLEHDDCEWCNNKKPDECDMNDTIGCIFWRDKDDAFWNAWEEAHPMYETLTMDRLIEELDLLEHNGYIMQK